VLFPVGNNKRKHTKKCSSLSGTAKENRERKKHRQEIIPIALNIRKAMILKKQKQ